jgi:predicted DNA-binding transcriptional regulator YafY
MTDVPKKLVVDVAAGTSQYIDLTPAEIQQRELDAIAAATAEAERQADQEAKATAKASAQAKLAALGLTEDEIAAL